MATKPKVKNRFSPRDRVISPKGIKPAQQQFKDDCDINSIMRKFQKTGTITHVSRFQEQYGFANPLTFHESMNVIRKAQYMFDELPSSVRNKFDNDPAGFFDFVQNPDNLEEAREMGLDLAPEALATLGLEPGEPANRGRSEGIPEGGLAGGGTPSAAPEGEAESPPASA